MDPAAVIAIVVLAVVVVALLVVLLVSRRATLRRLAAVSDRLAGPSPSSHRRLEAAFDRLEQSAAAAMERAHDATAAAERLRQALESVQHGVVVCDEDGTVVFSNGLAAGLIDARHNDVLAAQELRLVLDLALAGEPSVRQIDLYGPPRRTLVLTGVPLDDGASSGAAALVEDVSERRRVDAMRRDFVANISHELKTPVGALGLLAETLAGEDDPGVTRRLAERMQGEAFRVGRVIDDL